MQAFVVSILILSCNFLYSQHKLDLSTSLELPSGFSAKTFCTGIHSSFASFQYGNDSTLYFLSVKDSQGVYQISRGGSFANAVALSPGPGQFNDPDGFLVHPNGDIFITEAGGRNSPQVLYKIPAKGGKRVPFVTDIVLGVPNAFNPYGIVVAPPGFDGANVDPGDIILADNGLGRKAHMAVWAINPVTGNTRALAKGQFQSGPLRLSFSPGGKLLVFLRDDSGTSSIVAINSAGEVSTMLSNIPGRGALAVHPVTGDMFFVLRSDVWQIWHYPAEGGYPTIFAKGVDKQYIGAMQFSDDGRRLYVGHNNEAIEVEGPFTDSFSGKEYTMGSIGGMVVNSKDKTPYLGLTILAYDNQQNVASVETDAKGSYRLMLLPGEYSVRHPQGIKYSEELLLNVTPEKESKADFAIIPIDMPEILKQSMVQYKSFKGYRDLTTIETRMAKTGMDNKMTIEVLFAFERSKRIRSEISYDSPESGARVLLSDGEKMVSYMGMWKQYIEEEVPEVLTPKELLSIPSLIAKDFVMSSDPLKDLNISVMGIKELGEEVLDSISTRISLFERWSMNWIWKR